MISTSASFYLWFAIFTAQPHKEERFMYSHHARSACQRERQEQVEIECKVGQVKPPRFSPVDVWSFSRSTENVIENNVQRDNLQFAVSLIVDAGYGGL